MKKRMLIVEDNDGFRKILAMQMRNYSVFVEVIYASNTIQGEALVETHKPDIVLTDFKMKKAGIPNGIWLLRQIQERHPHIKRMLMSGSIPPGMKEDTGAVQAFFEKPFDLDKVMRAIGI